MTETAKRETLSADTDAIEAILQQLAMQIDPSLDGGNTARVIRGPFPTFGGEILRLDQSAYVMDGLVVASIGIGLWPWLLLSFYDIHYTNAAPEATNGVSIGRRRLLRPRVVPIFSGNSEVALNRMRGILTDMYFDFQQEVYRRKKD